MPTVFNTASALTIEQLSGERRLLRLVGRALPYRPFNLKTGQRVQTTWLPGSPRASVTVLGPTEDPSSISGYWKDKYLGEQTGVQAYGDSTLANPFIVDGSAVVTVRQAVDVVDALVREGQIVEVTWDMQTRHGYLTEFDKNWHNIHDLEWSMKFEWVGRGEPVVPSVFTQEVSISNVSSTIKSTVDDINAFALEPGFALDTTFYQDLLAKLQALSDLSDRLQASVANMSALALAPFNALRLAIATTAGLILQSTDMIDTFNSQVAGAINIQSSIGNQSAPMRATADLWVRGMVDRCKDLKYLAVDQRAVMVKGDEADILAVYTARDGDDLRTVSRNFYGTPNDWQNLMLFNGLSSAALEAGMVILIPKAST